MGRITSLIKNTGILFAAKAATQVVNLLLLPLYTAVLSTAEYGEIDLYVTASMVILPLLTLQIEQAAFRYLVGEQDSDTIKKVVSCGVTVCLALAVPAAVIYCFISHFLSWSSGLYVGLFFMAQVFSTMGLQLARGIGDNTGYGCGSFLITFLSLCFNIVFVAYFHWGVNGALGAMALAHLIASFYLLGRVHISEKIAVQLVSLVFIKRMLSYSIPLVFNQMSSWAVNYSSRFVILAFMGIDANGIYAVASKFSGMLSTVFGVFNLAWTENAVLNSKDGDFASYSSHVITLTCRGYCLIVIMVLSFLPAVFPYLVDGVFLSAYDQVPPLLLGMLFSGMAANIGSIYIAFEMTKSVAVTTFVSGLICVALNIAMASQFGLLSSSLSYLISFSLMFAYRYREANMRWKVSIKWRALLPEVCCLLIAAASFYLRSDIASVAIGVSFLLFELREAQKGGLKKS